MHEVMLPEYRTGIGGQGILMLHRKVGSSELRLRPRRYFDLLGLATYLLALTRSLVSCEKKVMK